MISAVEALKLGTTNLDLDRMLKIADQKVKAAVEEKNDTCCILFPKHIYSKFDIRNFKIEVNKLGYRTSSEDGGNSYCVELSW